VDAFRNAKSLARFSKVQVLVSLLRAGAAFYHMWSQPGIGIRIHPVLARPQESSSRKDTCGRRRGKQLQPWELLSQSRA